jgi:hypothetical protein
MQYFYRYKILVLTLMQYFYRYASTKDVQSTRDASSP